LSDLYRERCPIYKKRSYCPMYKRRFYCPIYKERNLLSDLYRVDALFTDV